MPNIDVELAMLNLPKDRASDLSNSLPTNYVLEDKYDLGWGTVIRRTEALPNDVNDAVCAFLDNLDSIAEIVRSYDSVFRVGIFYNTVTLTYRLSSISLLDRFSLDFEVSAYPSED